MSSENKDQPITREDILEQANKLATPIDFDQLIAEGVLEKKGAWYKILDMKKLPEHARSQINELTTDGKVKFTKSTKIAQKLVDKLSK